MFPNREGEIKVSTKDIQFECAIVAGEPLNNRKVTAVVTDANISEVLDNFTIEEILEHFDTRDLLSEMDEQEVKNYFDIE